MSIVTDKIAEYTAQLERVISPPTGDLGFGSDLSCTDDLTEDMAEVAGDSPLAVAQACYRRLITPRGSLPDDPEYGFHVAGLLLKGLTPQRLDEIPGQIRAELLKDDRVESLDVKVTTSGDLRTLTIDIRGETADGPFSLTLAVTDSGVLLKEIAGNGAA